MSYKTTESYQNSENIYKRLQVISKSILISGIVLAAIEILVGVLSIFVAEDILVYFITVAVAMVSASVTFLICYILSTLVSALAMLVLNSAIVSGSVEAEKGEAPNVSNNKEKTKSKNEPQSNTSNKAKIKEKEIKKEKNKEILTEDDNVFEYKCIQCPSCDKEIAIYETLKVSSCPWCGEKISEE